MNNATVHHSTINRRVYENPIIGDKAVFLKTSEETNGEYTLIEIELAPHGGNSKHSHLDFTETFRMLEGSLVVWIGKERKVLQPGETFTIPIKTPHYFQNPSDKTVKFQVELRPGHTGFENSIILHMAWQKINLLIKKEYLKNFLTWPCLLLPVVLSRLA